MANKFYISSIIIQIKKVKKKKGSFNSEIGIALALSFIARNFPLSNS